MTKKQAKPPPVREKRATDLSEREWKKAHSVLPVPTQGRRPYHRDRDVLDALLWLLQERKVWRSLPKDFPPWSVCHYRVQKWRQAGVLESLSRALPRRKILARWKANQMSQRGKKVAL